MSIGSSDRPLSAKCRFDLLVAVEAIEPPSTFAPGQFPFSIACSIWRSGSLDWIPVSFCFGLFQHPNSFSFSVTDVSVPAGKVL